MKKLLGIVVLGLLWCSVGLAETLELDQGIKINIPKNYEYMQFDQEDYLEANLKGVLPDNEIQDYINETVSALGSDGTETSTIIGKKGFVNGFGGYYSYIIDGGVPESWDGFSQFMKKCGKKNSEKAAIKCFIKYMKLDPIFQVDVINGTKEEFKELAVAIKEMDNLSKKEVKELNKESEKIEQSLGTFYSSELSLKAVKINNKNWGFEIFSDGIMMGLKFKRIGYLIIHNERIFTLSGFCFSQSACGNVKKLNNKILQPYLSSIK